MQIKLERTRAHRLLMMHCDEEPLRRSDIDEPLLVGIQDVHVARADHSVETSAHRSLVYLLGERNAEAYVVAGIIDLPLAVFLWEESVQKILVVDEPAPELERRVSLADVNRGPLFHICLLWLEPAPPVEGIDAEAFGREAVDAEHDAAIVGASDFQHISLLRLYGIVLPAAPAFCKHDNVAHRWRRRCRNLRPRAENLLHVARDGFDGFRHEWTQPRLDNNLRHRVLRDSERLRRIRHRAHAGDSRRSDQHFHRSCFHCRCFLFTVFVAKTISLAFL